MQAKNSGFDDFVDDCFIEEDPICQTSREDSLELIASQLLSELVRQDDDLRAA